MVVWTCLVLLVHGRSYVSDELFLRVVNVDTLAVFFNVDPSLGGLTHWEVQVKDKEGSIVSSSKKVPPVTAGGLFEFKTTGLFPSSTYVVNIDLYEETTKKYSYAGIQVKTLDKPIPMDNAADEALVGDNAIFFKWTGSYNKVDFLVIAGDNQWTWKPQGKDFMLFPAEFPDTEYKISVRDHGQVIRTFKVRTLPEGFEPTLEFGKLRAFASNNRIIVKTDVPQSFINSISRIIVELKKADGSSPQPLTQEVSSALSIASFDNVDADAAYVVDANIEWSTEKPFFDFYSLSLRTLTSEASAKLSSSAASMLISSNAIFVQWTGDASLNYEVTATSTRSPDSSVKVSTSGNSVILDSQVIQPENEYEVKIKVLSGDGTWNEISTLVGTTPRDDTVKTGNPCPGKDSRFDVLVSDKEAAFAWNWDDAFANGISHYGLLITSPKDASISISQEIKQSCNFIVNSLSPDTEYLVEFKVYDLSGQVKKSNVELSQYFTTLDSPYVSQGVTAYVGKDDVFLAWKSTDDVPVVQVSISEHPSVAALVTSQTSDSDLIVHGLTPGRNYNAKISYQAGSQIIEIGSVPFSTLGRDAQKYFTATVSNTKIVCHFRLASEFLNSVSGFSIAVKRADWSEAKIYDINPNVGLYEIPEQATPETDYELTLTVKWAEVQVPSGFAPFEPISVTTLGYADQNDVMSALAAERFIWVEWAKLGTCEQNWELSIFPILGDMQFVTTKSSTTNFLFGDESDLHSGRIYDVSVQCSSNNILKSSLKVMTLFHDAHSRMNVYASDETLYVAWSISDTLVSKIDRFEVEIVPKNGNKILKPIGKDKRSYLHLGLAPSTSFDVSLKIVWLAGMEQILSFASKTISTLKSSYEDNGLDVFVSSHGLFLDFNEAPSDVQFFNLKVSDKKSQSSDVVREVQIGPNQGTFFCDNIKSGTLYEIELSGFRTGGMEILSKLDVSTLNEDGSVNSVQPLPTNEIPSETSTPETKAPEDKNPDEEKKDKEKSKDDENEVKDKKEGMPLAVKLAIIFASVSAVLVLILALIMIRRAKRSNFEKAQLLSSRANDMSVL